MISYAQNFEDVMLSRVFGAKQDGFYIDIGAMDPVEGSVTKHFYDAGWSGINLEPDERFYQKLIADRARDVNLLAAAGDKIENRTFYRFDAQGISTLRAEFLEYFAERQYSYQEVPVSVTTLADICRQYVKQEIDFLKIDAEGWEGPIIEGADWKNFRPLVLVIEATKPYSHELDCEDWEPQLLHAGYKFVYFDGLNRFYLRKESSDLVPRFAFPPNVLDDFQAYSAVVLEKDRSVLQTRIQELELQLNQKSVEHSQELEAQVDDFRIKFETAWNEKEQERQRNQSLSKEIADLRTELESATLRYERYYQRNQKLAASMEEFWATLQSAQTAREEACRHNQELTTKLNTATAELEAIGLTIQAERQKAEALEAKAEALEAKVELLDRTLAENEQLTASVESLRDRIGELGQQLVQVGAELRTVHDKCQRALSESQEYQQLLEEAKEAVAKGQEYRLQVEALQKQAVDTSVLEVEVERLRSWLGRVSQEKASLFLKLEKATKELREHERQVRFVEELYTPPLAGTTPEKIITEILKYPVTVPAGIPFFVTVRLTNDTDHHLLSTGPNPVQLAYHWYDASTNVCVVSEGSRTALEMPLRSHSSREYQITVSAPAEPKRYILQSCVVQDMVMWFDQPADKCRKMIHVFARSSQLRRDDHEPDLDRVHVQ